MISHKVLAAGDIAPNFSYNTPWSKSLDFYKETSNSSSILIFLRYIGCPVCRLELANIKKNIGVLNNTKVFVILQSEPEIVASLTGRDEWPFTIVCDPRAILFKLYHVEPGGLFRYLHPAGLFAAMKALCLGYRHGKFEGRETQLPAAFVVSPDRMIAYSYYGKRIDDVPSIDVLNNHIK